MIISEWFTRKCQITKVNADVTENTDLYVVKKQMLLTSVGVYQERGTEQTDFDQLSPKYMYEDDYGGTAKNQITICEYSYHHQSRPKNKLRMLYLPEVWLWIGRGSDWYQYHIIKKVDGQSKPFRLQAKNDFVLHAGDKVHAYIKWPKLVFERESEPQQVLTTRQQEQFNSHVGALNFHIQGVEG